MSTQPVTGATRPVAVDIADITGTRATDPGAIARGWAARTRRPLLADDGRMLLVAADHPARGALGVRGQAMAMASRSDLLRRLATALSRPASTGCSAPQTSSTTCSSWGRSRTRSPSGR